LNELSDRYGFDTALEAMEEAAKSGKCSEHGTGVIN
jgi:hypothetical protein